jgi:hypothetical protein
MNGKRNLIMGLWTGLPFAGLEPFIASLRRTTFGGDVCLVVAEVDAETISEISAYGIKVERMDHMSIPPMHYQAARYFAYLQFLARNSDIYANVMITDVHDVVFQSDPFEYSLPADVVFAQERCLIGDSATNRNWIADTYGAAVADNLRNCMISCASTTFGTVAGMLRYLAAMTTELATLAGHEILRLSGSDQGIHNYLIRMRPLRFAWLDRDDWLVATVHFVPGTAVEATPAGVLIDGRLVPVLHQWDRNEIIDNYVRSSPRFKLTPQQRVPVLRDVAMVPSQERKRDRAVVAFYHPGRDAGWLALFLASLRNAGHGGSVHCTGTFSESELALLAKYDCAAYPIEPTDPGLDIDSVAHLFLSHILDQLADSESEPEQVLVLDSVRAGFLRDPFQAETIGLSVFHENPTLIADSEFNLHRLAMFTDIEGDVAQHPVVSSALLRGKLDIVRAFYRKLFVEFVGRAERLRIHKVMQGAINKLCHGGVPGMPIVQHVNGAEAYFEIWEEGLPARTDPSIRVGGAVPFAVLNPVRETELMRAIKSRLSL